ncbi:cold shock domain-containing protein [Patescibacteria group bacterium]|jgi:CspA family cold shock protein|nr:cold shock domain-containing protein [Patescibacteria group bacterium]
MKGTIVRLNPKGFGFIAPENGEKDVFFHARELQGVAYNDLKEGEVVTFEMTSTDRGPAATNVARA